MTPIPTFIHTLVVTTPPTMKAFPSLSPNPAYHVTIDNLSKLAMPVNPWITAFIAIMVAIITAALSWIFQRKRDQQIKEDEKREKLYAPLRLKLATIRSLDKHFERIKKAGVEAQVDAQKILDSNRSQEEMSKAISAGFAYSNEVVDKWYEIVKEIYELLQSNSGLIKEEHYKTVDAFIDAYLSVHYFEKQPTEKLKDLFPIKYYLDRDSGSAFLDALDALEKMILGDK